jgi:hypothetical protein
MNARINPLARSIYIVVLTNDDRGSEKILPFWELIDE